MKKSEILFLIVIIIIFFIGYLNFRQDDAYIFYTYAKNIADGNGYVFTPGDKVNATTSPLYTLLLALVYFLVKPFESDSLVYIGSIISVLSVIWILIFTKKLLQNDKQFILFSFLFFSIPLLKFGFGMETYFNLALITASVHYFIKKKYHVSFVLAGFSVLARLDSFLFGVILFLFFVLEEKRFPRISLIFYYFISVVPWFLFSKIYFDSYLPTTVGVKLSQQDFKMFGDGLIFFTGALRAIPGKVITIGVLVLLTIGSLIYILMSRIRILNVRGINILLVWSICLFVVYGFVLNAPPYPWYYTPFTLGLAILFSYPISKINLSDSLRRALIILLALTSLFLPLKNIIEGYNPKYIYYTQAANWLNYNTPSNTVVGVDEIGIIGYYYKKGKLVDALGLITPEVVEHLSKQDFTWYIENFSPDYIVNDYPYVQKHAGGNEKLFHSKYRVIQQFKVRGEHIAIYKRKAPQDL